MKFIANLISIYLKIRNQFSSKQFQSKVVHKAILIYHLNPSEGIREYYGYITQLLSNHLNQINRPCIVILGYHKLQFLQLVLPSFMVDLQIEHTLLKPSNPYKEIAIQGSLRLNDKVGQYLVRIANYSYLCNSDIIFDYSQINLVNIKLSGQYREYLKKTFYIAPCLYVLKKEDFNSNHQRSGTITTFGNPNDSRRGLFLDHLRKNHIHFKNISNFYDDLDSLYQSVQILVNVRQTDYHDTLEELRILPALRCGVIVISELAPYREHCPYSRYILWASFEDLPTLIKKVQNNYAIFHSRIFSGTGFTRRMQRLAHRNDLVCRKALGQIKEKLR